MNSQARRATDRPSRVRAMCLLALLPVAFVLGRCSGPAFTIAVSDADALPVPRALPEGIAKFHDASDEVTCWHFVNSQHGLACLPDQWLAGARAVGGE